jgi:hypothetical protein
VRGGSVTEEAEVVIAISAGLVAPGLAVGLVLTKKDGWTVVTRDGSWSAHFEHTLIVRDDVPEITTIPIS